MSGWNTERKFDVGDFSVTIADKDDATIIWMRNREKGNLYGHRKIFFNRFSENKIAKIIQKMMKKYTKVSNEITKASRAYDDAAELIKLRHKIESGQ